jgi:hypothetical protein
MTKQYDNYADLITFTRASTATYLDSDGLLKSATTNTPRIEYDADGNRLGLLIEEARTNLVTHSEDLTNSAWLKNATAVTANATLAPDGANNADKFVSNSATGGYIISDNISVVSGTTYTGSFYLKAAEVGFAIVLLGNAPFGFASYITVNLSTGEILQNSGLEAFSSESFGNGWWRFSVTKTASDTGTGTLNAYLSNDGVFANRNASITLGDGIFLFGAQLEAGSFPTSYIPTAGATATRAADVASIPTSAFGYNQKAGTVVCEFSRQHLSTAYAQIASLDDGTLADRISLSLSGGGGRRFRVDIFDNSVAQFANAFVGDGSAFPMTVAVSFALNDFAAIEDGGVIATGASGTVPTVNQLVLGNRSGSNAFFNGHLKSLQFYPRRLTNAQLQELTA